jgi:uncharacterized membrane protein
MAEEATPKKGKKVYTLDDIQVNEESKLKAALACIPIVGLVLLLVEKDDKFVRYTGAQAVILSLGYLISWFPVIGWLLGLVVSIGLLVMFIKAFMGQRFDVPGISDLALKLMAAI